MKKIGENIDLLLLKGTGKEMKSRVYVNEHKYDDENPTIKYYDYDKINEDGSSKVYIFVIPSDTFNEKKAIITKAGRDGDIVLNDIFTDYGGWEDLKKFFDENDIDYRYEEIILSSEERYREQSSQFGEHRCVEIHNMLPLEKLRELNEYEFEYAKSLLINPFVIYEIPFGWEEDDYAYLKRPRDLNEEEALKIIMNTRPVYLSKANECPEAIRNFLEKWNNAGNNADIEWYAKLANFRFVYKQTHYVLKPEAMGLDDTRVDHIFEMIEKDLESIGCKHIIYSGMLD